MRPFDSCSLCLGTARNPLACLEGHLFCKECVYESIIAQKKDIDAKQIEVEAHNQQVQVGSYMHLGVSDLKPLWFTLILVAQK
jgi:hypothetical protein